MDTKPIKTRSHYRATLKEIESLMDARANTQDGERLDVLVTRVEAYEADHFPLEVPTPIGRQRH